MLRAEHSASGGTVPWKCAGEANYPPLLTPNQFPQMRSDQEGPEHFQAGAAEDSELLLPRGPAEGRATPMLRQQARSAMQDSEQPGDESQQ